ncbi:MAG: TPM domain-containing protein [Verrucomicrobiae bacterium]|nr:TPM domain-containing protein [Verrucomicrobiae bacterium]
MGLLQNIVIAFPDDVEAKALYSLYCINTPFAYATELVIRQVLEREPDHPGAHHYRIHNWDLVATEQALESCRRYGRVSPNIGHSNHMPGHNYSKLGMWPEAAISMDHATRVELKYMNDRLALPFETWNFAHNRNYLSYIQEQLGMEQAALAGARALLSAPREQIRNKADTGDRKARIELGAQWERRFDEFCRRLMDKKMVPRFKEGNYGKGIADAVASLAEIANQGPNATPPGPSLTDRILDNPVLRFNRQYNPIAQKGGPGVILLMIVAGIGCLVAAIFLPQYRKPLLIVGGALVVLALFFWIVVIILAVLFRSRGGGGGGGGFGGGFGGGSSGGGGASGSW